MNNRLIDKIRKNRPLVHCITNHVTANDCANALLAVGARPIMAEHPTEVAEVTAGADALALNLGGISEEKKQAMKNAALSARQLGVPITLDLVGAAASSVRLCFAKELLSLAKFAVIKGNIAEIMALCGEKNDHCGVDSQGAKLNPNAAVDLAQKTGAVVLVSGAADFITDGARYAVLNNGCAMMQNVTGMGCILNVLCGAAAAVCDEPFDAAVYGAALLEIAAENCISTAPGSFHTELIDRLFQMDDDMILDKIKAEYGEIDE